MSPALSGYDKKVYGIISDLKSCLETHRKNIVFEKPCWINEIKFKKERELESEISKLENQMKPNRILLDRLEHFKRVLWIKHNELRDLCIELFNEMGLRTLKDDRGQEDFWILDEANSKVCICEVKGKDKDIVMGDVIKFEANRDAAGKDEDFPSLLIANTHNKASTLSEKDQNISSDVIQKTVRNNIWIIRTLDLLRILDMYENSEIKKDELLNKIVQPGGGWLRVNNSNMDIVYK
jgi:hypothetical protein